MLLSWIVIGNVQDSLGKVCFMPGGGGGGGHQYYLLVGGGGTSTIYWWGGGAPVLFTGGGGGSPGQILKQNSAVKTYPNSADKPP